MPWHPFIVFYRQALIDQAIFFYLAVERALADAEYAGSLLPTALDHLQRVADQLLLGVLQAYSGKRAQLPDGGCLVLAVNFRRQVVDCDLVACGQDDHVLDGVVQLADVARPSNEQKIAQRTIIGFSKSANPKGGIGV